MATEARRVVTVERRTEWEDGFARPRVMLQPYAAPSVLGLYGFAAATFMVALHLTGVYGGVKTDGTLWPFCALFGGVAQFTAGMWAFHRGDLRGRLRREADGPLSVRPRWRAPFPARAPAERVPRPDRAAPAAAAGD